MRIRRSLILTVAGMALVSACTLPKQGGGGPVVPPVVGTVTRLASGGSISTASISRNGRYVVFVSTATTPGVDHNATLADVFFLDRQTPGVVRVSGGNGASESPSVADDGSVVFRSASTDLAPPDLNGNLDAFRWTAAGGVTRITDSPGDVGAPVVSADGSTVVVGAPETLTNPAGSTRTQAFRWQVATPAVFTVIPAVGTDGSAPVAINADGGQVLLAEPGRLSLYESAGGASRLVASATPSPVVPHITTFSVSPHAIGDNGDVVFSEVTYSYAAATGVLSFESGAARLWHRATMSISPVAATGVPGGPVQSADGRHVLTADLTSVTLDQDTPPAFVRGSIRSLDSLTNSTVTVAAAAQATFGTVSADGRYVAFVSTDPTLAAPDPNGIEPDVYLWDRGS